MSSPRHNSTWKSVAVSSQQTGVAVWTPAAGKRIAVTHVQIGAQAATAAKLILWFGTTGDTSYTEGTDQPVFKGTFTPVAASGVTPVATVDFTQPIFGRPDDVLKITTSAALDCDVIVYGYET